MFKFSRILACLLVLAFATDVFALRATPRKKASEKKKALAEVCPKIINLNPKTSFWKNNKPIRACSRIDCPVIGQNPVMTFSYNPGHSGPLSNPSKLYASDGTKLATMVAFPCRSDHCGGRVVSSTLTAGARRKAVKSSKSPSGYVKLSRTLCVKVDDIGRCYGTEVNMGRPLCDRTLK